MSPKTPHGNTQKPFYWGVSTSALQIEGAWNTDGKGESNWDRFAHLRQRVESFDDADKSCNFYTYYKQDIALMAHLNIRHFRMSLSWSRILPKGKGKPNLKGIAFYNDVIDTCLAHGITPWVTLYHWDLPLSLEQKGGWTNRNIVGWFEAYVQLCARTFGDKVKHWMVLNEPLAFTGAGYFFGIHAPGRKGFANFLPAIHHAVLCQSAGGRILRQLVPDALIGTTFSFSWIDALNHTDKDLQAARRVDTLMNHVFLDPLLGLGYPKDALPFLKRITKYIQPGDAERMAFDFDFIGVQNYTREVVTHSCINPFIQAKIIPPKQRGNPLTDMEWEVSEHSLYNILKKLSDTPNMPPLIITEYGVAYPDQRASDGSIHDADRISFLQSGIRQMEQAKAEGAEVNGFFVWSLLDNYEWSEGYRPKFGLVHVDMVSGKRTVKQSGYWFRQWLREQQVAEPRETVVQPH